MEMKYLDKKKRTHMVFVVFSLLVLVTLCSPFPASASPWKWPKMIKISTASTQSGVYMTLVAAMTEMERATGMKVRVIPSDSLSLKVRWLKDGETEFFGDAHGTIAVMGMTAEAGHALREGGPFEATSVWHIYNSFLAFIVNKNSDIKTIYDIKPNNTIASFESALSNRLAVEALLLWAGADAKIVPCSSWGSTQKAVMEDRADITTIVTTTPVAFEYEASPRGVRCLDLPADKDPEGAKKFLKHARVRALEKVDEGIKACLGKTSAMMPFSLHARADLDPDLVYHFVKWLAENNDTYKNKNENCKYMAFDQAVRFLRISALPIHEGTIRYLKERGVWTAKDEARQEYNKGLLEKYIKAYKAAIAEADKKKIEISPTNQEWVKLWESYKKDLPPIVMHLAEN
jgi:TRAP transporter TAXI family solute receptor